MATNNSDRKPVCLIIGAGAGIGGHVGKRFAAGGYHVVLARRSDEEGLQNLVDQISDAGGEASGRLIDATLPDTIEDLVADVERSIGPIEVAVFNLGAQIGNRDLADTSYKAFEMGWRRQRASGSAWQKAGRATRAGGRRTAISCTYLATTRDLRVSKRAA